MKKEFQLQFFGILLAGMLCGLYSQPLYNIPGQCPEFEYLPIENYGRNEDGSGRWIREQYPVILPPQESIHCLQVPEGFRAELFASEQTGGKITATQAYDWDAKGRLWIVETWDYPNNVTDPFAGNDKVVILEDTDGDRVADKQTVFLENLNIPQGIAFIPDGILIINAPYLLLYKDEDGDDKADSQEGEIIFSGLSRVDTHQGVGNIFYGMDNYVYLTAGSKASTITGPRLSEPVTSRGEVLRFKPDGSSLELVASTGGCNIRGAGQNEEGQIFYNDATCGLHSQHAVVPEDRNKIFVHGNVPHPITDDWNDGQGTGNYTATSGHDVYTARYFPEEYWNRAVFTTDGVYHLTHTDFLTPKGSTWEADEIPGKENIMASTDAWTAPIWARVGPDGALWIADWYNYLYLHSGLFPVGDGRAYIPTDINIRDNQHARMYRIVVEGKEPDPVLDITGYSKWQLINVLGHSNLFYRLHAQRLLLKLGVDSEIESVLEDILKTRRYPDETGLDALTLHAVWTFEGYGVFASNPAKWVPILENLLEHPSHSVRQGVIKAMPATVEYGNTLKNVCTLNDSNAHVRITALQKLEKMPPVSGLTMFEDFRATDKFSNTAFANVGNITETSDKTCEPSLNTNLDEGPVHINIEKEFISKDYRWHFSINSQGLVTGRGINIPDGNLILYSIAGKVIKRLRVTGGEVERTPIGGDNRVVMYIFRTQSLADQQGILFIQ